MTCAFWLATIGRMKNWDTLLTALVELPWYYMFGSAAFVLAIIFLLIRLLNRGNAPEILAFETDGGKVTVSLHAIGELIQRAAASTDGVARCVSRIQVRRGHLASIRVKIHLRASSQLKEVEKNLQKRIAHTLRVTLGVEQIGTIDTVVASLVGEPEVPQDPPPHPESRLRSEKRPVWEDLPSEPEPVSPSASPSLETAEPPSEPAEKRL